MLHLKATDPTLPCTLGEVLSSPTRFARGHPTLASCPRTKRQTNICIIIGLQNAFGLLSILINEGLRLYTFDARFVEKNRREFKLPNN